ncbi:MAG: chorismate-binding protein [Acidothermaceae bacterium]
MNEDFAYVDGCLATGLAEVSHDIADLDRPGFWIVVATFEGAVTCARFSDVRPAPLPVASWNGPQPQSWTTSLDENAYIAAVSKVRERIAAGDVYQVNVCRTLSAPTHERDLVGLAGKLASAHPSRYPVLVTLPSVGLHVCSASPELFLRRRGDLLETRPIKGTGRSASDLSVKDHAENVIIVDMARNDLGRVAVTGSVQVTALCEIEPYPGLVQLVSTVTATLRVGTSWSEIFAATFPPASVSGAPKSSALRVIAELEPVPRGPYCGAVGFVDNARAEAALAVGIRTFWLDGERLSFGTGAGITWGSEPNDEWDETVLKAQRLVGIATTAVR